MGRRKPDSRTAKPDRSRLERRRLIVGVLCFLWFGCVAARLYYFQVIQYVELLARAQRQQQRTIEVAPQRGVIYDRQMNPLAMSLGVDSVFAVPSELTEPQMVASLLAPVLRVDADELRNRFQTAHSFCWVKRRVTPEEATRVRDLNLKGVYFQRETKRFYPKGDLAAQAIGYVGLDDKGLGGIEYALNDADQGQARPRAAGFRRPPPHLSQHRVGGNSRQERGADARRENPVHRGKGPGGGSGERACRGRCGDCAESQYGRDSGHGQSAHL